MTCCTTETVIPTSPKDEINRQILEVSEDQVKGFVRRPFSEIAQRSGLPVDVVTERIKAMLANGVIRRVRQTLLATNLATNQGIDCLDAVGKWLE